MRRINQCLNKQLLSICQRAIDLDELNHKVLSHLPENLRSRCTVASFNKGCLLLVIADAAHASELRFCLPTLRDDLRAAGLHQLISIKTQINTSPIAPMNKGQQQTKQVDEKPLSEKTRKTFQQAAQNCSYQPLKELLERIAGN
jgi:hypothetical protein